jgi:hypothetical protein
VSYAGADIVRLTTYGDGQFVYRLYFDGSDVGLENAGEDIDAFTFLKDGSIIVSTSGSFAVPGPNGTTITGTRSDLLQFKPTALGGDTAGSWSLYFDGSRVGLTTGRENIDAVSVLSNGNILISTTGVFRVPGGRRGVRGGGQDLLQFNPRRLGASTSGAWSLYFAGGDVGLRGGGENIDALFVTQSRAARARPELYFSTRGNFGVTGRYGADEDIFAFHTNRLGENTRGAFDRKLVLDGSRYGLAGVDIDGIYLGLAPNARAIDAIFSGGGGL